MDRYCAGIVDSAARESAGGSCTRDLIRRMLYDVVVLVVGGERLILDEEEFDATSAPSDDGMARKESPRINPTPIPTPNIVIAAFIMVFRIWARRKSALPCKCVCWWLEWQCSEPRVVPEKGLSDEIDPPESIDRTGWSCSECNSSIRVVSIIQAGWFLPNILYCIGCGDGGLNVIGMLVRGWWAGVNSVTNYGRQICDYLNYPRMQVIKFQPIQQQLIIRYFFYIYGCAITAWLDWQILEVKRHSISQSTLPNSSDPAWHL